MQTLTLRPNSDVSLELTRNTGSYNYACVDETGDGNGDTDYVGTYYNITWKRDLYGLPDHTTEAGVILAVRVYARHRRVSSSSPQAKGLTILKTNGTEYLGSEITPDISYSLTYTEYLVNPYTGVRFTWPEIDALQFGWSGLGVFYNQAVYSARCTQVWVEIDYALAAPENVAATKGTYTDKVVVTWDKVTGATAYQVYRDGTPLGWLGDVATYNDTGAGAPSITPGSAIAGDGEYTDKIALSLSETQTNNGTTHTYVVHAKDASANESEDSESDTGYRGPGTLTFQWQRSAADSDASYSNISGATTWDYDDTSPPGGTPLISLSGQSVSAGVFKSFVRLSIEAAIEQVGRYYKCVLDATGCTQQISTPDRGYVSSAGVGRINYQWQRSAADSDAGYTDIAGAVYNPYDDQNAPAYPAGRYYKCVVTASGATGATSTASRGFVKSALAPRNIVDIIIKNQDGETLSYVKDASQVVYEYRVNELGTCSFAVPADSPARDYFVYPNEAWLYIDGVLKDIYKIINVEGAR